MLAYPWQRRLKHDIVPEHYRTIKSGDVIASVIVMSEGEVWLWSLSGSAKELTRATYTGDISFYFQLDWGTANSFEEAKGKADSKLLELGYQLMKDTLGVLI